MSKLRILQIALPLIVALLMGLALSPVDAQSQTAVSESNRTLPLGSGVGQGDFTFYVDATATTPAADGRAVIQVLVQVPVGPLLEVTGKNKAELKLNARVFKVTQIFENGGDKLKTGPSIVAVETRGEVKAQNREDLGVTEYKLFRLALELPAEHYVLEVQVLNLSRTKKGVLDRMRKRPMTSVVQVLLRVPDLHADLALADTRFQVGYGVRNGYAARVYGLLNDSLHVATTLFHELPSNVSMRILDSKGEVHLQDSLQVPSSGPTPITFHQSVNTLPAGEYILMLMAENGSSATVSRRSFSVAWTLRSWNKQQRDLDTHAEILFSEEEFRQFKQLQVGGKEAFLENFWRQMDPTPDTAFNEIREEFRRRVAYSDLRFRETSRGALSDRGKVYVRFGAPTEIQSEALSNHLAGTGTQDLIEKIENPYSGSEHQVLQGNLNDRSGIGQDSGRQERIFRENHSLVVGRARELTSYELWLYSGGGSPLLPAGKNVGIDTGLRLLFVDSQGFGEYRLKKSSAKLDILGLGAAY